MSMPKPSERAVRAFESLLPSGPTIERRTMFGQPSAFSDGHLFFGVFGDQLILRLSEADRAELEREGGTPFEPMPGRPMSEYRTIPEALLSDRSKVKKWIARSIDYCTRLPPKAPRGRGRPKRR